MKKSIPVLMFFLLLATLVPFGVSAQGPAPITPENAANLVPLNRLGRGYVNALAFSPDGTTLAAAGSVGVWLYNTADPQAPPTVLFEGHEEPINDVAYSPDGSVIATASEDDTVRLWDVANAAELAVLSGHTFDVLNVAFSPDGSVLASADGDGLISLWDVANNTLLGTLQVEGQPYLYALAFSPDGTTLAAAGSDYVVTLWDVAGMNQLGKLEGHTSYLYSLAFSPDGSVLISGGSDYTLKAWDIANRVELSTWEPEAASTYEGLAFLPSGAFVTVESDFTGRLSIWDASTGTATNIVEAHPFGAYEVAVSPDGSVIATYGRDEMIRLWNSADLTEVAAIEGHTDAAYSIEFHPDSSVISAGYSDGILRLWDPIAAEELLQEDEAFTFSAENVQGNVFTPDGLQLVTMDSFSVKVFDMNSGALQYEFEIPEGFPETLELNPAGNILVVGTSNGDLLVWDLTSGSTIGTFDGHTESVTGVSFSPDGTLLASSSYDGTVRVWGVAQ